MLPHSFEQSSDPELLRHHAHLRSKLELGKREQRRLSSTTTSSSSSSSWDKHAVHHAASSPPTRSTVLIVRRTSSARALVNYDGVVTHSLLARNSNRYWSTSPAASAQLRPFPTHVACVVGVSVACVSVLVTRVSCAKTDELI